MSIPQVLLTDSSGNPVTFYGTSNLFETVLYRDLSTTVQSFGSVTNPGALATITSLAIPATGLYDIFASIFLSGTIAAADANNMRLTQQAVNLLTLGIPAVASTTPWPLPSSLTLNCTAGDVIAVKSIGAASGVSAVYNGTIIAQRVG